MRRGLVAIATVLLGACLTACTEAPDTGLPSAGGPGGSPSPTAASEQAFLACMRGEGQEMIDPVPGDTSGRSSLRYEIDVHGKGNDARFQEALEKCQSLLPPPPPAPPLTNTELEQNLKYAQCMRENGLPDFKDPGPDGRWGDNWILDTPTSKAAVEKCRPLLATASPSPQR